jgi:ankyrin repeat protein
LLAKGANVDTKTKPYTSPFRSGAFTPLMWAALNGHLDTVRVLLKANATVNMRNFAGETAVTLAMQGHHNDIITLLRNSGAKD